MKKEIGVSTHWHIDVLYALVVFIAASNYIVCKSVLESVPPFTLLSVRYLIAIAILSVFVLPGVKQIPRELMSKSFWLGLVLSVSVIIWQFGLLYADRVGPAAFIVSLDGLMVPILAWCFYGQKLSVAVWLAIPVALFGLAILNLDQGMFFEKSDLWFFMSAVGFAVHILLTHRYAGRFNAVSFAWGQMLVCGTITLIAALCLERDKVTLMKIAEVKFEIIYLAVVATALRFSLQNFVQKRSSAATAGFLFTTEPFVVALLGWLVLSETLHAVQLLGGALIFLGVLLARGLVPARIISGSAFLNP